MKAAHAPVCVITCSDTLRGRKILGRSLAQWRTQAQALFATIDAGAADSPRLAEVEMHICDAAEMADLNYRHLKHEGPTDVLTFPLDELAAAVAPARGMKAGKAGSAVSREPITGTSVRGVVVVCPAVAEAEANERGLPAQEELLRYLLHGALHLLGEDDKTASKKKRMHARQERILAGFLRSIRC